MQFSTTLRRARAATWLVSCAVAFTGGVVHAQGLKPLQLFFVNADGDPIPGVRADPGSFVYQGDSGRSFASDNLKSVEGGDLISGDSGTLSVSVPDTGLGELIRFKLRADHDSYAQFDDWLQVNVGGLTKIELTRGIRIAVTAVAEDTGASLQEGLFAIAEQSDLARPIDWKSNGKGLLLSRRLRVSDQQVRLVQIQQGEAVRFSEPIDAGNADGERIFIDQVPMSRSQQITGRLAECVPRPIHRGLISVCVAWPTETELQEFGPAGHWLDHSEIREDGTFVVKGLPQGVWIQVIASCEGWYSKSAEAEVRASAYPGENKLVNIEDSVLPALYAFNSSLNDVVIEMRPMLSAKILCVNTKGTPIANAKVIAMRSQRFFHGSWTSRTFRQQLSTLQELQSLRGGYPYEPQSIESESITDATGIALVENLPGEKIDMRVEGHRFPNNRVWKPIHLDSFQTVVLTIHR